ncbi:hypothetical protein N7467_008597 [Penicillium canescens]|nr:hypothetical protein N7467_008597 [Penicillium canescens]
MRRCKQIWSRGQHINCRAIAKAFIRFIEPHRIKLLLYIIYELGSRGITANKLKEVARDTKRDLKHATDIKIIYKILRVRETEERFKRRKVNTNKVEYVKNYNPSPTDNNKEEKDYFVKAALAAIGEPLLSNLSIPNPLNFEVSGLQNNPYYSVLPKYTNAYPMLGTSTSVHNQTRELGYYGRRVKTDSDQNISNRADYGSLETGQRVLPYPIQYHLYMAHTHLHHNHSQIPGAL